VTRDHHIVHKPHKGPMRSMAFAIVALVAIAGGGWALFDYGRYRAGFDSEAALQQLTSLEHRIQAYGIEAQGLREQIAILEYGKEIDQAAYVTVDGHLKGLQDELHELKQQLSFYQGIVSPADIKKGVRVLSFKFASQAEANVFNYKLILMQGPKRARQVIGRVRVSLVGLKQGKETKYSLEDLLLAEAGSGKYRFKYFQEFQGAIALPEGFEPTEVAVKLTPSGKNPKVVEELFEWNTLIN